MLVLGLNYGDHDPSAALIDDGRVLIAVEQERVSRMKRAKYQLPTEAIIACMREACVSAKDIDTIAVGWANPMLERMCNKDSRWKLENVLPGEFSRLPHLPRVVGVRHHLAHAASAYWCSGFDECAVLIVDGEGEDESSTLWWGRSGGLEEVASYPNTTSLGHFYKAATKYSGLEQDGGNHEGKFMGLAAYGAATEPMPIKIHDRGITFEGIGETNPSRIRESLRDEMHEWWALHTYPYSAGNGTEIMAYANFAASVQNALEKSLIHLAQELKNATRSTALAIAGGVGQNCAANGTLAGRNIFDRIFVQPACHDAGVSIGAALIATHDANPTLDLSKTAHMRHAYWGLRYSLNECRDALDDAGLEYRQLQSEVLVQTVAQMISAGKVVGWFHGPAEIGPRALGARSILADPRKRSNLVRLNRLKSREEWRPLAPSVLEESFDEYFCASVRSPFMNVACKVQRAVQAHVPAIVHVDGSARPQVVCKQDAPRYWSLLNAFHQLTGIPVLLNTSFNLRNEPIVNTPRDAIRDFLFSPLDVLVLEDFLVIKST